MVCEVNDFVVHVFFMYFYRCATSCKLEKVNNVSYKTNIIAYSYAYLRKKPRPIAKA